MSRSHRVRRLGGLSLTEAADRSSQAAWILLERASLVDARELSPESLNRLLINGASVESWCAELPAATTFFASFADLAATVKTVATFAPDSVRRTIDRADRLLQGRFDLLGYRDLWFGDPVDWHLDPVAGVRSPRVHWSAVRFLDPLVVGDHKVVWELNRHHVLVTLAQAYRLTSDERYAARAAQWLSEWMDANPPNVGANWASSLEIAYRSIAWLWALHLLAGSPHLDTPLLRRTVGLLYLSARHIVRHLSTWFSPNTHLTGEALGLFYLGTQLAMFREAAAWRSRGAAILLDQLPRQVHPDGVYFEQTTWYHRYTHDIYLHFLLLAERNGLAVHSRVAPALERMAQLMLAVARPDGSMPRTGDDDGGQLLFLDGGPAGDARDPLTTDAVLFGRGDFAAVAARPSAAAVWLLGAEAVSRYAALTPEAPRATTMAFPVGGTYALRTGWDREASLMVIDAGPHGSLRGGHAHADALGFDLTVRGQPLFVDPGTCAYTASPEWRDRFRATAAHNCVTVDGEGSSVPGDPFSWRSTSGTTVTEWQSTPAADLFTGQQDGFLRLPVPVLHERSVLFVRDGYWIVVDRVDSRGEHDVWAHLQCAPGTAVRVIDEHTIGFTQRGAERLRLHLPGTPAHSEVEEGWVSPVYGERVSAPRCRYGARLAGGMLVAVLVDSRAPRRTEAVEDAGRVTLRIGGPATDDLAHFAPEGAPWQAGGVESDARVLWVRRGSDGEPLAFLASRATYLRVDGIEVARRESAGTLSGVLHSATPGAA